MGFATGPSGAYVPRGKRTRQVPMDALPKVAIVGRWERACVRACLRCGGVVEGWRGIQQGGHEAAMPCQAQAVVLVLAYAPPLPNPLEAPALWPLFQGSDAAMPVGVCLRLQA